MAALPSPPSVLPRPDAGVEGHISEEVLASLAALHVSVAELHLGQSKLLEKIDACIARQVECMAWPIDLAAQQVKTDDSDAECPDQLAGIIEEPRREAQCHAQVKAALGNFAGSRSLSNVSAELGKQARGLMKPMLRQSKFEELASHSRLETIVKSRAFELTSISMIIMNSVCLGIEIELDALQYEASTSLSALRYFWCAWFLLELCFRISANRGLSFFYLSNRDAHWNYFDFLVVLLSVTEEATNLNWGVSGFRFIRILRIFRVVTHVHDFRKVLAAISNSMKSLVFALLLLCLMLYSFALFFTNVAVTHMINNPALEVQELQEHFGSVWQSAYTLYQTITNGHNWGHFAAPLSEIGSASVAVYILFVALSILGWLNILTSIFVQGSLAWVDAEKDAVIQEELKRKQAFVYGMQEIFFEIDEDDSGNITFEEFERCVKDEQMKAYFKRHGLEVAEMVDLFNMFDVDGSGGVEIDEFVQGCLKLQVSAKSIEVTTLRKKVHQLSKEIKKLNQMNASTSKSAKSFYTVFNRLVVTLDAKLGGMKARHFTDGPKLHGRSPRG